MIGDIRGSYLSSIDTTNVNADTLKPADSTLDSTFATATGWGGQGGSNDWTISCLLYTSPSPRD